MRLPELEQNRPVVPKGIEELTRDRSIDVGLDMNGIHATYLVDGGETWSGWLPHFDLEASRELTVGSASHETLWSLMEKPGKLVLSAKLNLVDMLRPAVQPGSKLDFTLPQELTTLHFQSPERIQIGSKTAKVKGTDLAFEPVDKGSLESIEVSLWHTSPGKAKLEVSFSTNEDARPRSLSLTRIYMPFARIDSTKPATLARIVPDEFKGGDAARGRRVFSSDKALCSRCHAVRGEGGKIGPDLSNLVHRDFESVARDVREPSRAINPDFIAYAIALEDGRVLSGTVRNEQNKLKIADSKGDETVVEKRLVEEIKPLGKSIMPEGLEQTIGKEDFKHLLAFLTTEGLEPAKLQRTDAPPPRRESEIDLLLGDNKQPTAGEAKRPLKILLSGGSQDHGPDEHDYPVVIKRWKELLGLAEGVSV